MINFLAKNRLSYVKELENFFNIVEQKVVIGKPSTFWQLESDFVNLIQSDFLINFLNYELGCIASDAAYIPIGGLTECDFALIQSKLVTLAIRILEPDTIISKRLLSRSEHCMFGVIPLPVSSALTYRSLLQPNPFPVEVLDPSKKLIDEGLFTVEAGSIVKQMAAHYVMEIVPSNEPIVVAFLMSEMAVGLQWEYERESLCPIRAIAASPVASRLQFTARMLAKMGTQESLEPLKVMLNHPAHYVRWEAVRAITMLNCFEGESALEVLVNDPHPHVSNAAEKALAKVRSYIESLA